MLFRKRGIYLEINCFRKFCKFCAGTVEECENYISFFFLIPYCGMKRFYTIFYLFMYLLLSVRHSLKAFTVKLMLLAKKGVDMR